MQVVWELIVMKVSCVIFILCFSLGESQSYSDKPEIISTKGNSTLNTEQKARKWKIKLDVYFNKSLPPVTKTLLGANVLLKCEAKANVTVERYSKDKDGVETSKQEAPPDDIQRGVLNITNVYWSKGAKLIKESTKYSINTTKYDDTIVTILKIEDLESSDAGNYTCIVKQTHEKRQTTKLIVTDEVVNYEIPTYTSLFPNSEEAHKSDLSVQTTPDSLPNMLLMKVESYHSLKEQNQKILSNLQPICQEYTGKQCAHHLAGHYVYIPYYTTQAEQEEKLSKAIQVTRFSNEISTSCKEYALPSLCYSTFPICREPFVSNENFKKEAKEIFSNIETEDIAQIFKNLSQGHNSNKVQTKFKIERLNYRLNSSVLRRVCKNDCIVLENELCQKEYAIAKRHPHIGMQLTLEDCLFLPEEDPDCLTMNIVTIMAANDECYWQDGSGINGGYLGNVSVASNGKPCIKWSKQLQVKPHDHPELAGMHSYCRNPGGMMTQPWCFVDNDGKMEKQLCDIPKCAHKIWIYIVIIFLILTLTIVAFIICFCYKHRYKGNAATIRDINLPNADKNIYGNSRHNSPIEMNELLTNQNSINQPHLTRPNRGNGVLRVPQYSLAQIKFLEELGEGAFGKVYKGALKKNGETQYVAVKALKENASAKTQSDFRREIDLISELSHDNIVCIVGVALKEEPLCMLFEFMARGDLHEFLMGRAPPAGKGLPANRLLNIAHNISSGMQYLASHHYVHRDLAARNCLVSDDFVVKISDFGLSRDIYSSDYYRVQSKSLLPVRWMPPESILYGKFTTESDIWSYGVVLWEIYSYGLQPYYGYSNQEVISMVRGGELLAPPAACPAAMYALMRDCWKHTPQRRPNFEEIVNRLQDWIQMGGCPETAPSDSGSSGCGHRPAGSMRDLQEKVPLLPPHCSSSNGSLATGSLKKFSVAGSSSKVTDDNCSTCSDLPPLAPKAKKHSSGSLIDADRVGRETIVRIPNTHHGNEI